MANYTLFPENFIRDASGNIAKVDQRWVNAGESVTKGLDLTARAELSDRIASLEAAMFWLEAGLDDLHLRPTDDDFAQIDFQGVLREAAELLKAEAENPASSAAERRRAEEALVQLFVMTKDGKGQAA